MNISTKEIRAKRKGYSVKNTSCSISPPDDATYPIKKIINPIIKPPLSFFVFLIHPNIGKMATP